MYYFAYGANLSHKQMLDRCPDSKPKFKATLPNYQLIFTGWSRWWRGGVASIKRVKDEKIVGGIYEISEKCLQALDNHEGYVGHPATFERLNVMVFTDDGDQIEAVTHIKREQHEETPPSKGYLEIMKQGFKDWGIV